MPDKRIFGSDRAALLAFIGLVCVLGLLSFSGMARAATWSIQATPNSAAEHSELSDISCTPGTTNPCVTVGKQTSSGGVTTPYAQYWNGGTRESKSVPVPLGATASELQARDCYNPTSCMAAGSYTTAAGTFTLVEQWSSGAWAIYASPNPEGASETAFKGVDCYVLVCAAVGYSVEGGTKKAFAEYRSGPWSIKPMPVPETSVSSELNGVDCPAAKFCEAVGSYSVSGGAYWAMAATWNGESWSLQTVPKPAGATRSALLDVSCASSSDCTAVGAYRNSSGVQVSFVSRWNGTSWSHQTSPNPVGSTNTVFQNVSCLTGTPCVAVGDWHNGKMWQPMAQEWNGSAWALDTTPTPAGATLSLLDGVACQKECLAVGFYINSEGKERTLGEAR